MPRKKKETKKEEAVEVKKMDLSKPFNLAEMSEAEARNAAGHLQTMLVSAGWRFLEAILTENKAVLEKQIVEKKGLTGEVLTDKEVDDLRIQHAQIDQMLKKPKEIVAKFLKTEEPKPETSYDPYDFGTKTPELVVDASTLT